MADNVEININAIVKGLFEVRLLVKEIEKLPNAGAGIKGLSAQFDTVQRSIQNTVKELDKAGNELKTLGTDTARVMQQASAATARVPGSINKVGSAAKSTKNQLAELSQTTASVGNALRHAFEGNVLGALQSLATALRSSLNISTFTSQAAEGVKKVGTAATDTGKTLTKFSSVLGTAAKNVDGALSTKLLDSFSIKAEQALLNPQAALKQFVEGLATMTDAQERAVAVADIFGASTASILPTLEAMVAAEQTAAASAAELTVAQEAVTVAETERAAASTALIAADDARIALEQAGTASAAELAAAQQLLSTTSAELVTADAVLVEANAALAIAEEAATVATVELAAAEVTAEVAGAPLIATLGAVVLAIAGVAAVAGVGILAAFALGKSFADAGSKIHDLAEETGLTAEEISVLKLAADEGGGSLDKAASSFGKYLKNVNEAAGGNKNAAATFKQLGIDAQAANKSSANALEQLFQAISKLPPGAQQVNAAMKLAGKSGADLIPIINQAGGSFEKFAEHAKKLGVVISTDDANAADQFGDTLTDLYASLEGIRNEIGAALLPQLQELANELLQFVIDNKQGFADLASGIVVAFKVCIGVFLLLGGTVEFLGNLIAALINTVIGLTVEIYEVSAATIKAGSAVSQFISGDIAGAVKTIESAVRDSNAALAELNENLKISATLISTPTFTSFFKLLNGGDGSTPKTNAIPKPKPTGTFRGGGGGAAKKAKVDPEIKAVRDALIAQQKEFASAKEELTKDVIKSEQEELKRSFAQNLIGYQDYYNQLAVLQLRANQAEIIKQKAFLKIEEDARAGATKQSERIKADTEIAKINNQLDILYHNQNDIIKANTEEVRKQALEYQKMMDDISNEIRDIENNTEDAAVSRINAKLKEATEKAQAVFDETGSDADLKRVERLKQLLIVQAKFTAQQDDINSKVAARDQLEQALNNSVQRGALTQQQANEQLAAFEAAQTASIRDNLAGLEKFANQLGDPKLKQAVTAIRLQLEGWKIGSTARDVDALKTKIDEAQAAFELGEQQRQTDVKNGAITEQQANEQRKTSLASYTAEADKLLATLEQIAIATNNTQLQAYIDKTRAGMQGLAADSDDLAITINKGFVSSFTNLFGALADGTKAAGEAFADFGRQIIKTLADVAIQALVTQLALKFFGGADGGQGGLGGFFSKLLGGDKGQGGFASGGYTYGTQGEPAGIVHGKEFVVKAPHADTHRAALEAMNAGLMPDRPLSAMSSVSPATTMQSAMGASKIQINNVLPNDLLDNYVSSAPGVQTFLNMIENNAVAFNARLKQNSVE